MNEINPIEHPLIPLPPTVSASPTPARDVTPTQPCSPSLVHPRHHLSHCPCPCPCPALQPMPSPPPPAATPVGNKACSRVLVVLTAVDRRRVQRRTCSSLYTAVGAHRGHRKSNQRQRPLFDGRRRGRDSVVRPVLPPLLITLRDALQRQGVARLDQPIVLEKTCPYSLGSEAAVHKVTLHSLTGVDAPLTGLQNDQWSDTQLTIDTRKIACPLYPALRFPGEALLEPSPIINSYSSALSTTPKESTSTDVDESLTRRSSTA